MTRPLALCTWTWSWLASRPWGVAIAVLATALWPALDLLDGGHGPAAEAALERGELLRWTAWAGVVAGTLALADLEPLLERFPGATRLGFDSWVLAASLFAYQGLAWLSSQAWQDPGGLLELIHLDLHVMLVALACLRLPGALRPWTLALVAWLLPSLDKSSTLTGRLAACLADPTRDNPPWSLQALAATSTFALLVWLSRDERTLSP